MKIFAILIILISFNSWAQSSMRRCTLLPVTDSVGGAVGYKVFDEVERELKSSNWCTYISNAGMMSVFTRYRENLPQHLKSKEVVKTVADKLLVGSIIRVSMVNDVHGVELSMEVIGENGEDIFFSEKTLINSDDIPVIASTIKNWLDLYSKTIPYDAKINGILGEQLTLDVGKGYPILEGQRFVVKRLVAKKKHPLLKKIVDWDTEILAEGRVFNISENQALGMVKVYKSDKKPIAGDWVRLEQWTEDDKLTKSIDEKEKEVDPGSLGILSLALFGSNSSVDTTSPAGSRRMSGNLIGVDIRAEGWITRQYFASVELSRALGSLKKSSGKAEKDNVDLTNSVFKLTGGYRYLPVGFFYGPQVDFFAGYANYVFDMDYSAVDGFGKTSVSGILLGVGANVPLSREYRFFAIAEILPFPGFKDDDGNYKSEKSVSAIELELGFKYQLNVRTTLDLSLETFSRKAKFNSRYKEVSYQDTRLKVGASFNF